MTSMKGIATINVFGGYIERKKPLGSVYPKGAFFCLIIIDEDAVRIFRSIFKK